VLEDLYIRNFQTHSKTHVTFSPTITTIVGPSDAGKSAVIRALRWVCTNVPGGAEFVRHDAKGANVKAVFDGVSITRKRGSGGINTYQMDDKVYRAFGGKVPEDIADFINMGPVCWQEQHDAPFWFSDSPGEVSRQLNTIVDLGVIDDTLRAVTRMLTDSRTRATMAEETLAREKEAYEGFKWLPAYVEELEGLEELEATHTAAVDRAAAVEGLVDTAVDAENTLLTASDAADAGASMVEAGLAAVAVSGRVAALKQLIQTAYEKSKKIEGDIPDDGVLRTLVARWRSVDDQRIELAALIKHIKEKEAALCQAEKTLKQKEEAIPKKCPTCGQSL